MRLDQLFEAETLKLPAIEVGDEVMVGKFKNRRATVKGFTKDDHNQPVLKTTKGDQKLFKPRIAKLMGEDVFHGTPYKFDRFSTDHIGAGQGAQSYGWGLYFTDMKEVAKRYHDELRFKATGMFPHMLYSLNGGTETTSLFQIFKKFAPDAKDQYGDTLYKRYQEIFEESHKKVSDVTEFLNGFIAEAKSNLSRCEFELKEYGPNSRVSAGLKQEIAYLRTELTLLRGLVNNGFSMREKVPDVGGGIYHTEIPDHNYLLWDKTLAEQPEAVIQVFKELIVPKVEWERFHDEEHDYTGIVMKLPLVKLFNFGGNVQPTFSGETKADAIRDMLSTNKHHYGDKITGQYIYRAISNILGGDKEASLYLASHGVPGTKYLDQMSRSAGEGTYNYVIYDDKHTKIKGVHRD